MHVLLEHWLRGHQLLPDLLHGRLHLLMVNVIEFQQGLDAGLRRVPVLVPANSAGDDLALGLGVPIQHLALEGGHSPTALVGGHALQVGLEQPVHAPLDLLQDRESVPGEDVLAAVLFVQHQGEVQLHRPLIALLPGRLRGGLGVVGLQLHRGLRDVPPDPHLAVGVGLGEVPSAQAGRRQAPHHQVAHRTEVLGVLGAGDLLLRDGEICRERHVAFRLRRASQGIRE
mmetsp:Transcript_92352/g.247055  ORF Transcript_92352/g.247055 Transcript_92352/m.247055 type:complete len:228 (+) Transcript_92352:319-1002(+)